MLTVYPREQSRGVLHFAGRDYPCALGRNGVQRAKREGDGATPVGTYPLRRIFYRPDRFEKPASGLPVRALTDNDGWCDDPAHGAYNQLVRLPFDASHETLWRDDRLYDLVVVIGHNDDPPQPGLGSAIFLHCASGDFAATQGCVALAAETLFDLLPRLTPDMTIRILEPTDQAP